MTKPRYHSGCAARSKVRGLASSPSDYAWNVNFNNGNVNWNNQNNTGFVRACRRVPAGECQDAVTLRDLYSAMRAARRNKKPSNNQATFEVRWLDGLIDLRNRLNAGTWSPSKSICFIASAPKAREIHAPAFADRVVHHWLIPQLEAIYEPTFIHDSYSNRVGKGTHAAVDRLRGFVREVQSGQGGGWYLQLDVANFFNSIHRPTLWGMLKPRLARAGLPQLQLRAAHALLRSPPLQGGVIHRCTAAERAKVPAHKRLENAGPGCGLPIGNLSSQFFANVYLDRLDQFVKHDLGAQRYVRYVDDFVLVHQSREQLEAWKAQIQGFLRDALHLSLKAEVKLKPLTAGIDFLGYVVRPTHTLVRRRVVSHAAEKFGSWASRHVRGDVLRATPEALQEAQALAASFLGHLRHADSWRLLQRFHRQFPWLQAATARRRFPHQLREKTFSIPIRGNST